jgi:predicted nucleic acid-binding protein
MIVVDTSAWIEFLRATDHPADVAVQRLLKGREAVATTEVVFMELVAGARSGEEAREVRSRLTAFPLLTLNGLADFEEAALLFHACRTRGETVRRLTDCLIAVPAIRAGALILHKDRDFDAIARHSDLRIYSV